MKIILSRKGFDSAAGKVASPILSNGEICSLPIPESRPGKHSKQYRDINHSGVSLGKIVSALTNNRIKPSTFAHLDPDLDFNAIPRPQNWRPVFGQANAAERHLQNRKVGKGDLFLFFGWFREAEIKNGKYRFVPGAPDAHIIFGWLQIEQRRPIDDNLSSLPEWARGHPHYKNNPYGKPDSIYTSTNRLKLTGVDIDKPGAGLLQKYSPVLRLTAKDSSKRSIWELPEWFHPEGKTTGLSYNESHDRWLRKNKTVTLDSAKRGQEFVLDCDEYPESIEWAATILTSP